MKGPSYTTANEAFVNKTKFMYFCTVCKSGPYYTKATNTDCPSCSAVVTLEHIDGEVVATSVKKTKRP